jgi:hypothetical protein
MQAKKSKKHLRRTNNLVTSTSQLSELHNNHSQSASDINRPLKTDSSVIQMKPMMSGQPLFAADI